MITAVIVAGGEGERLGALGGKQLASLAGAPMLAHTVAAVASSAACDRIVVVCHPDRVAEYETAVLSALPRVLAGSEAVPIEPAPMAFVSGGGTRQESVRAGIAAAGAADVILVHDGARPLITPSLVAAALAALAGDASLEGVVCGHPAVDTVKETSPDGRVIRTLDRDTLWEAQTPQVFRGRALMDAHAEAERQGFLGTDDASLVERSGGRVRMLLSPRENIKVTTASDLLFAEAVLSSRRSRHA